MFYSQKLSAWLIFVLKPELSGGDKADLNAPRILMCVCQSQQVDADFTRAVDIYDINAKKKKHQNGAEAEVAVRNYSTTLFFSPAVM